MNKQALLATLETLGMRPGRGLGQNFLLDANLLDSIVRDSGVRPGDFVLEVGPGLGALTRKLLAVGARVTAVEYDHRLAAYLREQIRDERFTLVEADACKVDFAEILPPGGEPFLAIANLPYAISTVFIGRMLELAAPPRRMFFMLQKEMAERLAAAPGGKAYGSLSVRTQLVYQVAIRRTVPPEVFHPAPEVDSALAEFTLKPHSFTPEMRKRIGGVVKTAFLQRRKQLGKTLGNCYGRDRVAAAFAKLGLPHEIRPDKVPVETFVALSEELFP